MTTAGHTQGNGPVFGAGASYLSSLSSAMIADETTDDTDASPVTTGTESAYMQSLSAPVTNSMEVTMPMDPPVDYENLP